MLKHCLIVFLVSMVPVIELRGAIPYGVGFGLPLWLTYCVAIAGNMLPVPVIYFFARRVLVWGSGKPVIGFLAEYDALSGLSQEAGSTEYHELVKGGSGHGCGHNLLGAGAMAAAMCGRVDAVILTGGIAHNEFVVRYIEQHCSFIAPVSVYPGENELESLVANALVVLRGTIVPKVYA